jgi:cytochrome b subunit of formate dehydrogenase
MKAGNKCLYYCKQFFNILLGISGIIMLAIGIYIWAVTKIYSTIELSILILGGIQIFLSLFCKFHKSILALSSKTAKLRIKLYNFILGIILLA